MSEAVIEGGARVAASPIGIALLIAAGLYGGYLYLTTSQTTVITTTNTQPRVSTVTPLPETTRIMEDGCIHHTMYSPEENVRYSWNECGDGVYYDEHFTDQNVPRGQQGRHTPEAPTMPTLVPLEP